MRIAQLKQELESYGFSTNSFIEKRELVDALKKARNNVLYPENDASNTYDTVNDVFKAVTAEVVTDEIPKKKETVQPNTNTSNNNGFMGGLSDIMNNMGDMFRSMSGIGGVGKIDNYLGNSNVMDKVQQMMKNPKIMDIIRRAQQNPRFMKIMQECMANPRALQKYKSDPEVGKIIRELSRYM